jgi:2-polyprenyl-3-methyl-5-hydroxy-6-metoxy-1,4-benzoquinol methylase
MALDKNSFDAALQNGVRTALAASNNALRQAERTTFNKLLDADGNFLPGASFVRDCPQCGTAHGSAAPILRAHGMQLLRCKTCSLVYSREVIDPDFDRQRYEGGTAANANVALKQNSAYAALERAKAHYVAGRLSQFAGSGSVLDIGSSNGTFLAEAALAGWSAYGIEINAAAVALCTDQGQNVVCGEYPAALPSNWAPFDAIAIMDVLEHVTDPLGFLASLRNHLTDDGWLLVQVPNFSSLLLTIEGGANSNFCHGHWSYFEPETLPALLKKAGFEMHFFETYITELDRALAYPDAKIAAAWHGLTQQTLDNPQALTVDRLHDHLLGYKLFGLFQKVAA